MRSLVSVLLSLSPALAFTLGAAAQAPEAVPVREGVTIVTAIHQPNRGDFESIKQIDAVADDRLHLVYSADQGGGRHVESARTVLRQDLEGARRYRNYFNGNEDKTYDGWTALGPSKAVMADLATSGEAAFTFQVRGGADRDALDGTLSRVGAEAVPVLVNGRRVELEAVRAEGIFGDYQVQFWFLDAPEQPITLRYHAWRTYPPELQARLEELAKKAGRELPKLSEYKLDVVKIEYPADDTDDEQAAPVEDLEQALEQTGRAEVYGIYFDFGSDTIRPESEPVLAEIAGLLQRNPGWKLDIEGHTDNIGGDEYNLDLSNRRAAAVKAALVDRHGIDAGRLETAGFGASRPKESNDTLAGRARNRRVELVRR